MQRALSHPMETDLDFRNLGLALIDEIASGRIHVIKAKVISEVLVVMKDTLVGPQQTNVNVLLQQLMQVEGDATAPIAIEGDTHPPSAGAPPLDLDDMHRQQVAHSRGDVLYLDDFEDEDEGEALPHRG